MLKAKAISFTRSHLCKAVHQGVVSGHAGIHSLNPGLLARTEGSYVDPHSLCHAVGEHTSGAIRLEIVKAKRLQISYLINNRAVGNRNQVPIGLVHDRISHR